MKKIKLTTEEIKAISITLDIFRRVGEIDDGLACEDIYDILNCGADEGCLEIETYDEDDDEE